jgi:hypothetical protein
MSAAAFHEVLTVKFGTAITISKEASLILQLSAERMLFRKLVRARDRSLARMMKAVAADPDAYKYMPYNLQTAYPPSWESDTEPAECSVVGSADGSNGLVPAKGNDDIDAGGDSSNTGELEITEHQENEQDILQVEGAEQDDDDDDDDEEGAGSLPPVFTSLYDLSSVDFQE